MPNERPIACVRHVLRDSVTLCWADGQKGEVVVRGGVAWPRRLDDGRIEGCMLVGGYFPKTGAVGIMDEILFSQVDHTVGPMGEIVAAGVCSWLASVIQAFEAVRWMHHDTPEIARPWEVQVWRSTMVPRKPAPPIFVTMDSPERVLVSWLGQRRLAFPAGGVLARALHRAKGLPPGVENALSPAELAAASIVGSFDAWPWMGKDKPFGTGEGDPAWAAV